MSSLAFWAAPAVLVVGLIGFSQTLGYFYDESDHLQTAQLINAGKRPYIDFFWSNPPLYGYLNAGLMRVLGASWRGPHLLSALLAGGCVAMVTAFVFNRISEPHWRHAAGMSAGLLLGLHIDVIDFGTIAMPYALCLLLSVASFLLVTRAVDRQRSSVCLWPGLCAGAAAASSLLAAPIGPILLLWLVRHNQAGHRLRKFAWFAAGMAIPFLPLLWLVLQSPRAVLFDVVEYNLFYRVSPGNKVLLFPRHLVSPMTLRVLTAWLNSTQGLMLAFLAAVGLLFLGEQNEWDSRRRAEFYLCAWLAGGLAVFLATPFPTFSQYFVLLIPFLSILASLGVYAIGSRVWTSGHPSWLILGIFALYVAGLMKPAYQQRFHLDENWQGIEAIAEEVNRVTPTNGLLFAGSDVHFAAKRLPPPGLESWYAVYNLPSTMASSHRVMPRAQVDELLASGHFTTVVIGAEDPRVRLLDLPHLYARRKKVPCYSAECYIFWDKVGH